MECCSSTSSSDCEEDPENVRAILAADTVTVRTKEWGDDINMKRQEKGEFHHLVKELEEHPNRYEMYFRSTKEEFNFLHDLIRGPHKNQNHAVPTSNQYGGKNGCMFNYFQLLPYPFQCVGSHMLISIIYNRPNLKVGDTNSTQGI